MAQIKRRNFEIVVQSSCRDEAIEKANTVTQMKALIEIDGGTRNILVKPQYLIRSDFALNSALLAVVAATGQQFCRSDYGDGTD